MKHHHFSQPELIF